MQFIGGINCRGNCTFTQSNGDITTTIIHGGSQLRSRRDEKLNVKKYDSDSDSDGDNSEEERREKEEDESERKQDEEEAERERKEEEKERIPRHARIRARHKHEEKKEEKKEEKIISNDKPNDGTTESRSESSIHANGMNLTDNIVGKKYVLPDSADKPAPVIPLVPVQVIPLVPIAVVSAPSVEPIQTPREPLPVQVRVPPPLPVGYIPPIPAQVRIPPPLPAGFTPQVHNPAMATPAGFTPPPNSRASIEISVASYSAVSSSSSSVMASGSSVPDVKAKICEACGQKFTKKPCKLTPCNHVVCRTCFYAEGVDGEMCPINSCKRHVESMALIGI